MYLYKCWVALRRKGALELNMLHHQVSMRALASHVLGESCHLRSFASLSSPSWQRTSSNCRLRLGPMEEEVARAVPNMRGGVSSKCFAQSREYSGLSSSRTSRRAAHQCGFFVSGLVQTHCVVMPLFSAHWHFQQDRTLKARWARRASSRCQHQTSMAQDRSSCSLGQEGKGHSLETKALVHGRHDAKAKESML